MVGEGKVTKRVENGMVWIVGGVSDGDPVLPHRKGYSSHTFRVMSIVAKRSPISGTAELLLLFIYVV